MPGPTIDFWQVRFAAGQTPWDRGEASPQLRRWLDAGALRSLLSAPSEGSVPSRIVVPGCGAGWEVAELARRGFEVMALDYAPAAVERTRALIAREGLTATVEQADVLEWRPRAPFDAAYEQTCLCAIHPDHWIAYAGQLHSWLRPGGALYALFMQMARARAAEGYVDGPPYHCDMNAMRALFPAERWDWPKPPYASLPHPMGATEVAVVLVRR